MNQSDVRHDDSENSKGPSFGGNAIIDAMNGSDTSIQLLQLDPVRDQQHVNQEKCAQLEYFYNFVTEELRDVFHLRERLKSGQQEKIRFEDLWHLFEPRDIICSRRHYGRDQLYRTFAVTGGQTLKSKGGSSAFRVAPDDPEDDNDGMHNKETDVSVGTWMPFRIDCYKMAFDGVYCGPVDVCKVIRPYVGEREIANLPVYPIMYHHQKDTLLQQMEERGRKILFQGGHKSYENRSITLRARGEMQEQIESDVYIDFEAFFQDSTELKPTFGSMLRSRPNQNEVEEAMANILDSFGMPPPPRNLSGNEVDTKRSEDFLGENQVYLESFEALEHNVHREHLILLHPWVVGYVFKTRSWRK